MLKIKAVKISTSEMKTTLYHCFKTMNKHQRMFVSC